MLGCLHGRAWRRAPRHCCVSTAGADVGPQQRPIGVGCWTCALTDRLVAELIRSRLTVGLRHKAARGELRLLQGRLRRGKCVVLASGSLGFLAAVRH
jgi:hypothetical protein